LAIEQVTRGGRQRKLVERIYEKQKAGKSPERGVQRENGLRKRKPYREGK